MSLCRRISSFKVPGVQRWSISTGRAEKHECVHDPVLGVDGLDATSDLPFSRRQETRGVGVGRAEERDVIVSFGRRDDVEVRGCHSHRQARGERVDGLVLLSRVNSARNDSYSG